MPRPLMFVTDCNHPDTRMTFCTPAGRRYETALGAIQTQEERVVERSAVALGLYIIRAQRREAADRWIAAGAAAGARVGAAVYGAHVELSAMPMTSEARIYRALQG